MTFFIRIYNCTYYSKRKRLEFSKDFRYRHTSVSYIPRPHKIIINYVPNKRLNYALNQEPKTFSVGLYKPNKGPPARDNKFYYRQLQRYVHGHGIPGAAHSGSFPLKIFLACLPYSHQ